MRRSADQHDLFQGGFNFEAAAPIAITRDLPADPIAHYRGLIDQHHAAMMAADHDRALEIRKKAHDLADDMNGGTSLGILEAEGSATKLGQATKAEINAVPLWGQIGDFVVMVGEMPVRIELDGIFGIGASMCYWIGFAARRVEGHPFFTETGYRSFLGIHAEVVPGITPDEYARKVIQSHIDSLKPQRKPRKKVKP